MVCPQERIGDGVVATKGDQACAAVDERECLLFDLPNGGGDVEGIADEVPGIDHLLTREGGDVQLGVVRPEQSGRLADVGRAEPSAGSVRHAGVERDADDGHVTAGHILVAR
jgi:hypothetical protein